ncbi:unnamed protein product [Prorocentrum cordatum]|uniref:Nitronate monooxygenase domain-containing protein n=1 Tax=Prorocentrum cordatum TaxID=2364126 RepID=A0ABN9TMT7_9DINO|nr:unnamed protein product [Polarella glacialis]
MHAPAITEHMTCPPFQRGPKGAWANGPPGESASIKALKAELSALRAQVGGGGGSVQRPATQPQPPQSDFTFGQVVQFPKAYKIEDTVITTVQQKQIAEQEAKPTTAIAVQHRVENSKRKVERLKQKVLSFTQQRGELDKAITEAEHQLTEARSELERNIKVSHRVHLEQAADPLELGFAGLTASVKDSADGRQALEVLRRLQEAAAKKAADEQAAAPAQANSSAAPAGAGAPDAGVAGGGPQAGAAIGATGAAGYSKMEEDDFDDSESHDSLKRLYERGAEKDAAPWDYNVIDAEWSCGFAVPARQARPQMSLSGGMSRRYGICSFTGTVCVFIEYFGSRRHALPSSVSSTESRLASDIEAVNVSGAMLQERRCEFQGVAAKGVYAGHFQVASGGCAAVASIDGPPEPAPSKPKGGAKSLTILGVSANAWSTAEMVVEWLMDRGIRHGGLDVVPDALSAQEIRLKNPDKVATSILIPTVVDLVRGKMSPLTGKQVSVVAAGGIFDGRGLAMALSLGADAVWVGTRFVASAEGGAPRAHKEAVVAAGVHDTHRCEAFSGRPLRVIKTKYSEKWLGSRLGEMRELLAKGTVPVEADFARWQSAEGDEEEQKRLAQQFGMDSFGTQIASQVHLCGQGSDVPRATAMAAGRTSITAPGLPLAKPVACPPHSAMRGK